MKFGKYFFAVFLFFLSIFLNFSNAAYGENSLENEMALKNRGQASFGIFDKAGTNFSAGEKVRYAPGEVIVKFKEREINSGGQAIFSKAKNFAAVKNLSLKENFKKQNIGVFKINDSRSVESAVQELKKDPSVEYAQPNFIYYPLDISSNDTYKNLLWGLDNTGQTVNGIAGTADADIDAPEAWAINEGTNTSTIVAIIDTGVAYNHPDLAANMWDGTNCKDENGVFLGGCQHGYDYLAGDNDPLPIESSHGTHVAGTIAAVKNNGQGIIGVAPNAKIMAVKAGEESLSEAAILKGIAFAEQNGAKIINASWGGSFGSCAAAYDEALYQAIQEFDGLFITAAGNDAANHNGSSYFGIPADFGHAVSCWTGLDNVISVAAANSNDSLAYFSDYGSNFIDVAAPGVDAYSTVAYYYSTILNEDFEGVVAPNIPADWTKEGSTNNWRTASVSSSNVFYGDLSFPYADNASSSVTSPAYDLSSTTEAAIGFSVSCDTEYDLEYWTDYLSLFLSSDGANFSRVLRLDEFYIDMLNSEDPYSSSSAASMYFSAALPSGYLTSNFKIRFKWTSDEDDNNYDGCWIDNLNVSKISDSLDGTGGGYDYMSGTSMAVPHVAGLAALIWGENPNLTLAQVKNAVINTGDFLSSLSNKTVTGKKINARNALNAFNPVIGHESDNVIPTSSINQATNGTGIITVNFKVKDGIAGLAEILSDFGYSIDGGSTWKAPTSSDASTAFSNNWTDNSYAAAADYSSSSYSFSFNSQHSDFADFNNAQQDNVKIRFKAADEAKTGPYAVSGIFAIDNVSPSVPAIIDPAENTKYTTTTNYTIIGTADAGSLVKAYLLDITAGSQQLSSTSTDYAITVELAGGILGIFDIKAFDGFGNSANATRSVSIIRDENQAALSLASVGADSIAPYNITSSVPEIVFSASDTSPTLDCRWDTVDAGYSAMPAENEFSASTTVYASSSNLVLPNQGADGLKNIYISCKDLAENENSADNNLNASFILDTVAPTAVLSNLPSSGTTAITANIIVGGTGASFYKYKLDGGSYSSSFGTSTSISLSGLSTGSHAISVIAGDEAGNWQNNASPTDYAWTINPAVSYSGGGGGGGGAPADTTAPVISDVNIAANATSAVIVWKTNESSFSWIIYGTSTNYGKEEKKASYLSSHSITLNGLFASTAYHYKIKTQDSAGNIATSSDKIFTTLSAGMATTSQPETQALAVSSAAQNLISQMAREQLITLILQILSARGQGISVGGITGAGISSSSFSGVPAGFIFQNNLKLGMNSLDVKYLQIVLNSSPDTRIVSSGLGSFGYETIYFGKSTLAAVKKFQTKYGIVGSASVAYGLVGPATRAKLNSLLGKQTGF